MATHQIDPTQVRFSSPNARRIARLADLLGWSITWASHQQKALKLRSAIDAKEILLPVKTSLNANRARASIGQVLTHSETQRVNDLVFKVEGDLTKDDELAELAVLLGLMHREIEEDREAQREEHLTAAIGDLIAQAIQVETPIPNIKGEWYAVTEASGSWFECRAHETPMRVETRAGIGGHNRSHHSEATPLWETRPAVIARQEATEVARIPWLAKGGLNEGVGEGHEGRVWEHPYVEQVTYSDGRVEFECAICHEFAGRTGKSAATHVGKAHPEREPVEKSLRVITDYPEPSYHRHVHSSPRLRADLLSALDAIGETWHSLSREELARKIEEYIVENRPERAPAEPLTDTEVLARIAALVDRGEFDHLRRQVESLTTQVVEITTQRDDALSQQAMAQQQADRERSNLTALREMLDDLVTRKEATG